MAKTTTTLRKTIRSRGHGALIRVLTSNRERAGLSQRDLAARLKRPHSFVGRIEAGERRIDVIEFIAIAEAIDADPMDLFRQVIRAREDQGPRSIGRDNGYLRDCAPCQREIRPQLQ